MDKGRIDEAERLLTERELLLVGQALDVFCDAVKILQHGYGFGHPKELHIGGNLKQTKQRAAVIGFHVVDHHVIQRRDVKDLGELCQVFLAEHLL